MFDIGEVVWWVECKDVDGTPTVYVLRGLVVSGPNDPYNRIACIARRDDDGTLIPINWRENNPQRSEDYTRQAAFGYATSLAALNPGKAVSVRMYCNTHKGGHKMATITCTSSDRKERYKEAEKTGKSSDINEQFTIQVHPITTEQ